MSFGSQPQGLHLHTPGLADLAGPLLEERLIAAEDLWIVDAAAPRFGEDDPKVLLALALAVRAPRLGHIGLKLPESSEDQGPTEAALLSWAQPWAEVRQAVLDSPLVGGPNDHLCPFVHQEREGKPMLLLSRRLYREQERLASALCRLASTDPAFVPAPEAAEQGVMRCFGSLDEQGARAALQAARASLTVVAGGPGTGKTFCIQRLLALFLEWGDGRPMKLALAAPTGKAAARMAEALAEGLDQLPCSDSIKESLAALKPQTLHRLLGIRRDGSHRYGTKRSLPSDLIVVDEASMVDLRQMRLLVEALGPGSRLILLGDPDQLASVEAGSVLADLLEGARRLELGGQESGLVTSIVRFRRSYRFASSPQLAGVVESLQEGSQLGLEKAQKSLGALPSVELSRQGMLFDRPALAPLGEAPEGRLTAGQLKALVAPYIGEGGVIAQVAAAIAKGEEGWTSLTRPDVQEALLRSYAGYRVLCAHRRGPLGLEGVERALEQRFCDLLDRASEKASWSWRDAPGWQAAVRMGHFPGRPLLITQNAPGRGLMNGDTGLVLPGELGPVFVVLDPLQEGHEGWGLRRLALNRLPPHEGGTASTVHKTQGSQFPAVALVLSGRDSPLQTRELVYTALTRSSGTFCWLGSEEEMRNALGRRAERASGLAEVLVSMA